jgi:hypothetical protein
MSPVGSPPKTHKEPIVDLKDEPVQAEEEEYYDEEEYYEEDDNGEPIIGSPPKKSPLKSSFKSSALKKQVEMTVRLDTTMHEYNENGGNANFIKTVTSALQIDKSLMKVT